GRIIRSEQISSDDETNFTIDASELAKGVYFVSIMNESGEKKTVRIVVE
ncbi:MAG TPA: hypothetical protein DCQ93_00370, partial [Bacteroidetes bacterium]|nr:hypothetical protein [Bacteroidota bacterium]